MVDQNGLIDVGYVGFAYTWNNRSGVANIQERLNRGLLMQTGGSCFLMQQ